MTFAMNEVLNYDDALKAYDIYKHCMYMPTLQKYEKKFSSFLQNDSVKIYTCFECEKIVGIIVISIFEKTKAEILGIAVDTSVRGKGIGSYMIEHVKRIYNLNSIFAETDDAAVCFYQKNNFTTTKTKKNHDGETFVRYHCELTC